MTLKDHDAPIWHFLSAELEEKQRLLEGEGQVLLEPASLQRLLEISEQESRDDVRQVLDWHLKLLVACRADSVPTVFERLSINRHLVDLQNSVALLATTSSWAKVRHLIETKPDVMLSDALQAEIAKAILELEDGGPELRPEQRRERSAFVHNLRLMGGLLKRCQLEGVAAVDAELRHTPFVEVSIAALPEELLRLLDELRSLNDEDESLQERVLLRQRVLNLLDENTSRELWAEEQFTHGGVLIRLGRLENDPDCFRAAVLAFGSAQRAFDILDVPSEWKQRALNGLREAVYECRTRGIDLFDMGIVTYEDGELPDDTAAEINELFGLTSDKNADSSRATLHRIIQTCGRVIPVLTTPRHARLRAEVQVRLGYALTKLGQLEGDPAHFKRAVDILRPALAITSPERNAKGWARTAVNLATALMHLSESIGGEGHLDEAVNLLREINRLSGGAGRDWLAERGNLGDALLLLGKQRGDPKLLAEAVAVHKAVLTEAEAAAVAGWVPYARWRLGAALRELGGITVVPDVLLRAVDTLTRAREEFRQKNCERAPGDLMGSHPVLDLPSLDNELGIAFSQLGNIVKDVEHFGQAHDAFRRALEATDRITAPMVWAMIQLNLGNALIALGTQTRKPDLLVQAVEAFRGARAEYHRVGAWSDVGLIDNNMGNALGHIGDFTGKEEYYEKAIDTLNAAVEQNGRPTNDKARSRVNLGIVLAGFAKHCQNFGYPFSDVKELAERAIAAFDTADGEFTIHMLWERVTAKIGRARALFFLGETGSDADRLSEALAAYDDALTTLPRKRAPQLWATTQKSRGDALTEMGRLLGHSQYFTAAEEAYLGALGELSPAKMFTDYAGVCRSLGALYLLQKNWKAAAERFCTILDLVLPLARSQALIERQFALLPLVDGVGDFLAYSYWRQGMPHADVLRAAFRGRGVFLDTDFGHGLRGEGLDDPSLHEVSALAGFLPVGGALVVPIVSPVGAAAIIVCHGTDLPEIEPLDDLTVDSLNRIRRAYFHGYSKFVSDLDEGSGELSDASKWGTVIRLTAEELGRSLMAPLHRRLKALGFKPESEVLLMPRGRLSILPLTAAPIGEGKIFLEEWAVSYVPSPNVLIATRVRARERESNQPTLVAVTNPTKDIGVDVSPAAHAFQRRGFRSRDLRMDEATKGAVCEALPNGTHLCFYCHGTWTPTDTGLSGLVMAEKERAMHDQHTVHRSGEEVLREQLLTVDMLRDLDLSSGRFAMLAACDSWHMNRSAPDEFVGLPMAFVRSGIPAVVASLWPVAARATLELTSLCFESLLTGKTPAAALREAQLSLLRPKSNAIASGDLIGTRDRSEKSRDGDDVRARSIDDLSLYLAAGWVLTGA